MPSNATLNYEVSEGDPPRYDSSKSIKERIAISIMIMISSLVGTSLLAMTWLTSETDPKITKLALVFTLVGTTTTHIVLPICSLIFLMLLHSARGYFVKTSSSNTSIAIRSSARPSSNNLPQSNQSGNQVAHWVHKNFHFDSKRYSISIFTWCTLVLLIVPISGDVWKMITGIKDGTMMSDSYQTARFSLRMSSFIINFIPTVFSVYCSMTIYKNIVRQSDSIREMFLKSNTKIQQEKAIQEIQNWSYNIFPLHDGSRERKELCYANMWTSCCLVCYTTWIMTYSLYVVSMKDYHRYDLYMKAAGFSFSALLITISMYVTNNIIDNMKTTIMIIQNKNKTSAIDRIRLSLILGGCEPYALVLNMKPSIAGITVQIVTGIAPYFIAYVRSCLNI